MGKRKNHVRIQKCRICMAYNVMKKMYIDKEQKEERKIIFWQDGDNSTKNTFYVP